MLKILPSANNNIYYKIFDKHYKLSSGIYTKYKYTDAAKISEINQNRAAIINYLSANELLIMKQVHGNKILDADEIDDFQQEYEADGAVTSKKFIVLAVQTADCVPLLIYDSAHELIGAAHCGWRGAKSNIIHNLVAAIKVKLASKFKTSNLYAILGPAIWQESYEVDKIFYENFVQESQDYGKFFIPSLNPKNISTHYMFDLPAFVRLKLQTEGIQNITQIQDNTYNMPDKYPSYRWSCHQNIKNNESILSTIIMK